jgi:hypothetical protein
MTLRSLYEWAKEKGVLDLDVVVQYRDGGGYYNGSDDLEIPEIAPREYDFQTEKILII